MFNKAFTVNIILIYLVIFIENDRMLIYIGSNSGQFRIYMSLVGKHISIRGIPMITCQTSHNIEINRITPEQESHGANFVTYDFINFGFGVTF